MNATNNPDPPRRAANYHDPTTTEERTEIRHEVRAARRAAGLTQPELARLANVSTRVISRIENGHRAEPRGREDVLIYLGLRPPRSDGPATHSPGQISIDLAEVPSVALLAELGRRVGDQERPDGRPRSGPPVRIRWKTADGPTQSQPSDQDGDGQKHPKEE